MTIERYGVETMQLDSMIHLSCFSRSPLQILEASSMHHRSLP